MYKVYKQQVKQLTKSEYLILKELTHCAAKIWNEGLYQIRKHYRLTGEFLSFPLVWKKIKGNSSNYSKLDASIGTQILRKLDSSYRSFFTKKRNNDTKAKPPGYNKTGFFELPILQFRIDKKTKDAFKVPFSFKYRRMVKNPKFYIKFPPMLIGKEIVMIRIIPRSNARFFEIQYVYEEDNTPLKLDNSKALAIDFGINNLCTCVTNDGNSFIVDGKKLKSYIQWYNKYNAKLKALNSNSFKKLPKKKRYKKSAKLTYKQTRILRKRNNRADYYVYKSARIIIDYCIKNNIGNLVIGWNKDFKCKRKLKLCKKVKQTFTNMPFGKIKNRLEYLCKWYGIKCTLQEESYTSKANFLDNDCIPTFGIDKDVENTIIFSGIRKSRGLYETFSGIRLNADVNGALNILRKSKVVSLIALSHRGALNTPIRIRI